MKGTRVAGEVLVVEAGDEVGHAAGLAVTDQEADLVVTEGGLVVDLVIVGGPVLAPSRVVAIGPDQNQRIAEMGIGLALGLLAPDLVGTEHVRGLVPGANQITDQSLEADLRMSKATHLLLFRINVCVLFCINETTAVNIKIMQIYVYIYYIHP